MTGPLAPLFAILDKAIGCAHPVTSDEHDAVDEAPAALSSIERHVQDMEKALRQALNCKGPCAGTVDRLGGDPAICPVCEEAVRAALPAPQGDA